MSHTAVLVIGDDPETILAPYQEREWFDGGKWDWYQLGGRWTGYFSLKPGTKGVTGAPGLMTAPATGGRVDQARKKDIDLSDISIPFAICTKDGWAERGKMGWFGTVTDEKDSEDWEKQARQIIENASDDSLFSLYDLHI